MDHAYVLDRGEREFDRLDLQGILYADATRRALLNAGVSQGMRVLDVGCGSGDLSRQAASLVGPDGSVLGVDIDAGSIQSARTRSAELGFANVAFQVGEAASVARPRSFDVLVGRFFLMHQPSPGRALADIAQAVRPGGAIMMLESHMASLLGGPHSFPHSDLYDAIVRWKCRVVAAAGADLEAGLRLNRTFHEAKLPAPQLQMEAPAGGGRDSLIYRYMAESMRSMLPMAEKHGIDGFTAERVDEIEVSLRDQALANDGVLVCWPVVSAYCRLAD